MKNQIRLFLVAQILFFSCGKKDNIPETANLRDAKWAMYFLNFKNKAVHVDDTTISFEPVECLMYTRKEIMKTDTLEIYFSFRQNEADSVRKIRMLPFYNNFIGVGLIHGEVTYPITGNITYDFVKDSVQLKEFMEKSEKDFIQYLRNYKGKINPWLEEEIRRRKLN